MSIFEDRGGGYGMAETLGKAAQCKRDYEGDIKRFREAKKSAEEFRDSVYKYVSENGGSRSGTFTLADLIGRLELEIRDTDRTINRLIEEQERDK